MGMFDNLKNMFTQEEERYDENDLLEEELETPARSSAAAAPVSGFQPGAGRPSYVSRPSGMRIMVMEPKTFEDSEAIATYLRDMCPVILNFEHTEGHVASRIVDFISGSTYALDGKLDKVSKDIFIVAPSTIGVERAKQADSFVDMPDTLAWKDAEVR